MKYLFICFLAFFISGIAATAQTRSADSAAIIIFNQQIDNNVLNVDLPALEKMYAEDFVFSHGSGKIEGKASWLKSLKKGSFIMRMHDSVTVELHKDLAIVRGRLNVQKKSKEKISRYNLHYVRVYGYRNKNWQLISHVTVSEFHEPE